MKVLLVGSGAREHALAAALARSPLLSTLFIAPGNPGTEALGTNVAIAADDVDALVAFAAAQAVDMVIPGPEAPLVLGLADACQRHGILCAGPSQAAAALEGSKNFTKQICDAAHIPTARWKYFTNPQEALLYLDSQQAPIVVKADGLAAGKGVVVAQTLEEARASVKQMMTNASLGAAGGSVVIEECLVGEEVSLFAFCHGEQAVLIGAAQDHKRIGEGDTGPNTGGMGAVSPPKGFGREAQEEALELLVRPMLREMARRGTPFVGVIFAGIMLTPHGPRLIEYNVRFGDPEAQALMLRLRSDLLVAFKALCTGALSEVDISFSDEAAISIVMAGRGYPGAPARGSVIEGLHDAVAMPGVQVFQAATRRNEAGQIVGDGGRVLSVCATAPTVKEAQAKAYDAVSKIRWKDGIWRRDIGNRAL